MSAARPPVSLEDVARLVEQAKADIIKALPRDESRAWRVTFLALPIVLTSVLGLAVYFIQSPIAGKIDENSKRLQATLSLTQDFYQNRLKIYMAIHEGALRFEEKAARAEGIHPEESGLEDDLAAFQEVCLVNSILLSRELRPLLRDFWKDAIATVRGEKTKEHDASQLHAGFEELERQMRQDLYVDSLLQAQTAQPPRARLHRPSATATPAP